MPSASGGALVPVIAQSVAGEVLMLGFANKEALHTTFESRRLTFWSRSRGKLWTKGETSGHFLEVVRLRADCDRDTVLATVVPRGSVCHTGSWTCFSSEAAAPSTFERLYGILADRLANPSPGSYTASLDGTRVREKLMEEAGELADAEGRGEVIWECADLLYFIAVLMNKEGVTFADVLAELDRRHKK
jgi:phosphoribosyl-ATP pyrophosphohydrolase/phosphoribosyl-AMP cyclohydrolase